jgi:CheY-like chemotaxis protein
MQTTSPQILHIDPDADSRSLVTRVLCEAGYRVESLDDPLYAIDTISHLQVQIVLLESDMPIVSGLRLVRDIKLLDAGVQVIVTAHTIRLASALQFQQAGAEALVLKPLDHPRSLLESVAGAVARVEHWNDTLRTIAHRRQAAAESIA